MNLDEIKSWVVNSPLAPLAYTVDEWRWFLQGVRRGSFAQHGEDVWILNYFANRRGVYVDVGANYPIKISNTYLLYRKGWRGMTVEPIPRLYRRHKRYRPLDIHINAACGKVAGSLHFFEMYPSCLSTFDQEQAKSIFGQGRARIIEEYNVKIVPLQDLIDQHLKGLEIDLLSVDTEGHDCEVLEGLDWTKNRPKLIVAEVSAAGRMGDDRISRYLETKDYKLIKQISCNSFFSPVK